MAKGKNRDVALLSIHPRHATAILTGVKRVEFRKTRFRRAVSHVVLYATSPIQRVVGYFKVARITSASPAVLWARYSDYAGINDAEFTRYYAQTLVGTAMEVGNVRALATPLALRRLRANLTPPQSYLYLDAAAWARLERVRDGAARPRQSLK
jgi:predicted transcriptional regulator